MTERIHYLDVNGNDYSTDLTTFFLAAPINSIAALAATYTLTSQTAAQKLFNVPANGALTLPVGVYVFESQFSLSAMSATSASFGFALGGTATLASIAWECTALKTATPTTAAAPQVTFNTTAANTAIATASTSATGWARIHGIFRVSATGTVIPQVSLGVAAAAVVAINSYFRVSSQMASATGTTVGSWA